MGQMADTFCGNLWRSLSIDKSGGVYACCHFKPWLLGNIHDKSLEKIWNDKQMRSCRRDSLKGGLECLSTCTILNNFTYIPREMKSKDLTVDYKKLMHLVIFFGNQCNLRCLMCRQDHTDKKVLGLDLLMSRVNFANIKYVDILGGEPFVIPDVLKFFDFLIYKKIKAGFISNGTIMTDTLAKKIAYNCYSLMISLNAATKETHEKINAGSKWRVVMDNIKKVNGYRLQGGPALVLHGRMTIVSQNLHEVPLFIEKHKKFGFDKIDFGFDQGRVPGFLASHPAVRRTLSRHIQRALGKVDIKDVMLHRLQVLGLVPEGHG